SLEIFDYHLFVYNVHGVVHKKDGKRLFAAKKSGLNFFPDPYYCRQKISKNKYYLLLLLSLFFYLCMVKLLQAMEKNISCGITIR
ncbi:MAG: hypothetical protein LUG96_11560, partial [Tannerellaceae bacterium]|nr:hypothetical protein [Tannerellaceae bacterium]